jgi:hypothetical protein
MVDALDVCIANLVDAADEMKRCATVYMEARYGARPRPAPAAAAPPPPAPAAAAPLLVRSRGLCDMRR